MFWFLAMGFAAYVLFFKAASESWTRRWRGPGARAARCGLSGHEVARQLLADAGLADEITVGRGRSGETARFVAGKNKLLLGPDVHDSQTVGAVMLAALAVANATAAGADRRARDWRGLVTGVLHPALGVCLVAGLLAAIFHVFPFRAVMLFWLAGGIGLLVSHAMTMSWEYKAGARAIGLLRERHWIASGEEEDFDAMRKATPLRDVRGIGSAVARALGALLPFKGWK